MRLDAVPLRRLASEANPGARLKRHLIARAAALAALLLTVTAAHAAECVVDNGLEPPEPAKIGKAAYPTAALLDGVEGRGIAQVTVSREGKVSDGVIVADQPAGYRFGQAALNVLLMDSRFRRGQPGNYKLCIDFRLAEETSAEVGDLSDAPVPGGGPILAIHSPAALKAEKDGSASVFVKINGDGKVVELIGVNAEPAGLLLERAAAVTVASTQFETGRSGRYRARVIFNYAALKAAYDAGKPFSMPGLFVPEPDPDDYPTRASLGGAEGLVALSLDVGNNGLLKRIGIERETPKRLGFGLVALYYGNKIIFHPMTDPGKYMFTLRFVQRFK